MFVQNNFPQRRSSGDGDNFDSPFKTFLILVGEMGEAYLVVKYI